MDLPAHLTDNYSLACFVFPDNAVILYRMIEV